MLYYSFPVALPAITADTGWSQTDAMAAFSTALVVAAAMGAFVGQRIDRRGPRVIMSTGSSLAVLAVVAVALAPSLAAFVAAWALAGIAQSMVLYAPAFTAITRWYGPARTRALLILTLVAGLASTIFAPLTAHLVELTGWRRTYLALAALLAVTTIPAHIVGLRAPWPPHHRPVAGGTGPGWRHIARSRAFLTLTTGTSLAAFAMFAATIHLVPMLTWRGMAATTAAWALGLSGAGQLLGRIAYGPVAARTTPVPRAAVLLAASAATIAAVGLLGGPPLALVGAAIALGVTRGAFTLLQSTAVSDRWGTAEYGILYGILNAPTTLAMALAPWAAAIIEQATDSYPVTYSLLVGLGGLGALLVLASGPRVLPSPNRVEPSHDGVPQSSGLFRHRHGVRSRP